MSGRACAVLVAATLCALAASAHAGDREHFGLRLNTGLGMSRTSGHFAGGAAIDVPVGRYFALVADAQGNYAFEQLSGTLAAGVRVHPWRSHRVAPYVTAGAGVWSYYPHDYRGHCRESYAFLGLGAAVRLSRYVSMFGEIRTRPLLENKSHFDAATPVIVGVRLGI